MDVELATIMEPAMKSFRATSTERMLERAAEFTIAKIDDPASIWFRATFVNLMLPKAPAFFLEAASDEMLGDMGAVVEISARHLAETPEMQAGIHGWIDRVMDYSADKTLGEVLQIEGSGARPPIDALADATWPAFTNVLGSPQARAWMDRLLDELIDEYERMGLSEAPPSLVDRGIGRSSRGEAHLSRLGTSAGRQRRRQGRDAG